MSRLMRNHYFSSFMLQYCTAVYSVTIVTPLAGFLLPRLVRKGLRVNTGLRLGTNCFLLFLVPICMTHVRLFSCVSEEN